MKPAEIKDSDDVVTTNNSIKVAEGIVKAKMPNPDDKEEKERMKNAASTQVEYHLHTDDEEDPETVETRKSVKTIEKRMKHRFFINAKERKMYDEEVAAGKISQKELDFAEGDEDEIGTKKEDEAKKEAEEGEKKAELSKKMDKEVADLKAKEEKDAFIPPELDMAASKEKKDKAKQAEQKAEKKADEAKK